MTLKDLQTAIQYKNVFYMDVKCTESMVFWTNPLKGVTNSMRDTSALGWAWFGRAASQPGAGEASFDITNDKPTHISLQPAFHTKL